MPRNLGLRSLGYIAPVMAGRACDSRGISQSSLVEFRVQEGCVVQGRVGRRSAWAGMTCPAICSGRYMVYTFGLRILRHEASVMAGRASACRGIAYRGRMERHTQECREHLGRRIRVATGACRSGWQRDVYRTIDRNHAGVLPLMAGSTGGTRRMGKGGPEER